MSRYYLPDKGGAKMDITGKTNLINVGMNSIASLTTAVLFYFN